MKVIYNNIIPFPGYKAINLFGILFVRKGCKVNEIDLNHEKMHSVQIFELLVVFFYLWYVIEWIVRLFQYGSDAYRNISFEREAYDNEGDLAYLYHRKPYSFIKYLKAKTHI